MSAQEIRLAKNELYARHGWIFTDASVQLKESGDKNGFIERLKECIDSEKNLQIYEKQSVRDEGSNYNFVWDIYVNGTDKMAEVLSPGS